MKPLLCHSQILRTWRDCSIWLSLLKRKMAQNNYTIEVKIWDEWVIDTYSPKGYLCYVLMEVGNKLYLMEKYLNDC